MREGGAARQQSRDGDGSEVDNHLSGPADVVKRHADVLEILGVTLAQRVLAQLSSRRHAGGQAASARTLVLCVLLWDGGADLGDHGGGAGWPELTGDHGLVCTWGPGGEDAVGLSSGGRRHWIELWGGWGRTKREAKVYGGGEGQAIDQRAQQRRMIQEQSAPLPPNEVPNELPRMVSPTAGMRSTYATMSCTQFAGHQRFTPNTPHPPHPPTRHVHTAGAGRSSRSCRPASSWGSTRPCGRGQRAARGASQVEGFRAGGAHHHRGADGHDLRARREPTRAHNGRHEGARADADAGGVKGPVAHHSGLRWTAP